MKPRIFKREHTVTAFVILDTRRCEACWECINVCTNQVIGRINLPWHKHVRFVNGSDCSGCRRCVNVCKSGAIRSVNKRVGGTDE